MNTIHRLWMLMLSYFQIGVGENDPDLTEEVDEETEESSEEEESTEESEESTEETAEATESRQPGRKERAVIEARRRAQEAETRAADVQRQLDEIRRAQQAPQVDRTFAEEEDRLRRPETTELERWQIQSNRTIRQSQQQAAMAQMQAADTSDRTAYQAKSMDNPRMRAYADRVEKRLSEMRAQGQNAPREAVYRYMLGEDVDKGLLKPAAAKPKAGALPASQRGKPVGARSDVQGKAGKTEAAKRRARLENQVI